MVREVCAVSKDNAPNTQPRGLVPCSRGKRRTDANDGGEQRGRGALGKQLLGALELGRLRVSFSNRGETGATQSEVQREGNTSCASGENELAQMWVGVGAGEWEWEWA